MKKASNILEKIGFGKEESLVYRSLLQLGPSSMSEIIRKTGIHRPKAYKIIPELIEKGLVTIVPKEKSKLYAAESPDKIERLFTDLENEFNSEIQNLYEAYEARGKKPVITYSEGNKAIVAAYSDVVHSLNKNDTYYRYSSALTLQRKKYVPKDYRSVRDKKGLERMIITNAGWKQVHADKLGRAVKIVPPDFDLFDYNISLTIYGDKVAFIDYNSKTTITIQSAMIAEFQKKIFKLLFKKL